MSRRQRIVQRVGPDTGTRVDCDTAVGGAWRCVSNAPGFGCSSINIRCGERTADRSCAVGNRAVIQVTSFNHTAGIIRSVDIARQSHEITKAKITHRYIVVSAHQANGITTVQYAGVRGVAYPVQICIARLVEDE